MCKIFVFMWVGLWVDVGCERHFVCGTFHEETFHEATFHEETFREGRFVWWTFRMRDVFGMGMVNQCSGSDV